MKICAVSDSFVALILEGAEPPDQTSAQTLVRYLLEQRKKLVWKAMYIDIFTAGDCTLLLARPEKITKISIAPYALPYLMDYFTE